MSDLIPVDTIAPLWDEFHSTRVKIADAKAELKALTAEADALLAQTEAGKALLKRRAAAEKVVEDNKPIETSAHAALIAAVMQAAEPLANPTDHTYHKHIQLKNVRSVDWDKRDLLQVVAWMLHNLPDAQERITLDWKRLLDEVEKRENARTLPFTGGAKPLIHIKYTPTPYLDSIDTVAKAAAAEKDNA